MSSQCLKAEDMANAVIYVLSAPPHVQVSCGWVGGLLWVAEGGKGNCCPDIC